MEWRHNRKLMEGMQQKSASHAGGNDERVNQRDYRASKRQPA
jgi:hypothetical protein